MNDFKEKISISRVKGRIIGRWVSTKLPSFNVFNRHNMLSYAAADVLAAAYGGDISRIPKYVGFIYGNNESAILPELSRDMTMTFIDRLVERVNGNMQVVRFSRPPTVFKNSIPSQSEDSTDNAEGRSNGVEFHAVTRTGAGAEYVYPTTGTNPYCDELKDGKAIYRAVLLGEGETCSYSKRKDYTVLAMVDLSKNGQYRKKPENYELALNWRVTFE